MRLIDADVADKWMKQNNAFIDFAILKAIPTIDAVPVVRKPVPGYEGYYEVDNLGRVFSVDRIHLFTKRLTGLSHGEEI